METVRKNTGIETLVVGSEGDASRGVTESFGHHYLEHENRPVSRKFNAGLKEIRKHNPSHVMILGSDDIVSDGLFETYKNILSVEDKDIMGIHDLFFLGLNRKRWGFGVCGYWAGNKRRMLGVARMFSAYILDMVDWELWYDDRNAGLDAAASKSVANLKDDGLIITSTTLSIMEHGHLVIDIKTEGNISSMSNFELRERNPTELFKGHLPKEEADAILEYIEKKTHEFN
jgi:hypothetical protein